MWCLMMRAAVVRALKVPYYPLFCFHSSWLRPIRMEFSDWEYPWLSLFLVFLQMINNEESIISLSFWVMFYPCLMPLTPFVSLVVHIFVSFLPCLGGTFFQAYLSSLCCFWGGFLLSFGFNCLVVCPFGVPLSLKTIENFILLSFIVYSSADSTTICCSSCDLASQLYLVHIFLYLLSANVINSSLSIFSPLFYLSFWFWVYLTKDVYAASIYLLNRFDIMLLHLSPIPVSASYLILAYSSNLSMSELTMVVWVSRLDRLYLILKGVVLVTMIDLWISILKMRAP